MDLVIDTSAVLAVLLDEPERGALIEATAGATLCIPPSVPWEVGNAVSALVRRRRLTRTQARRVVQSFEAIPVETVAIELERAVDLADVHGLYAYDAYLLEAARARRAPLVTLDRALRRAAGRMGIHTVEIGA
ncbi:MAG: type II toxin-antitoxin system VapC family toxin [Candidatus Rokubacteria bacterium]|nr:type II toxin-antitoxin system VapC family toxin [Candidatus Rokubacteria bacterium]